MPFSTPNTFVDAATIEADEFNENFEAIADAIDADLIHADGSVAFTAVPTGPATDPSTNNHLARKRYVDEKAGGTKSTWIKVKDSGGSQATLKSDLTAFGTAGAISDEVSDLTISVAEEENHYYRATFVVPEIGLNADTTFGVAPRVGVTLKRSTTEIARSFAEHNLSDFGVGITLVSRPRLATATATVDWSVFVRNGTSFTPVNVRYKADTNYPMYHYIEDLGTTL